MNIKGKKIFLRAIEESDIPSLHSWANDPQTQHIMGDINFPSSMKFHLDWFNNLKNEPFNKRFAIESYEGELIGLSHMNKIDWKNSHAWHGIVLGNSNIRGKGYGFDSVMTTMKYAFDELNFQRLDGAMISYNTHSINFYCNKLGWKKEGKRKNYYYRDGKYWDKIDVGILRKDYYSLVKKLRYWE